MVYPCEIHSPSEIRTGDTKIVFLTKVHGCQSVLLVNHGTRFVSRRVVSNDAHARFNGLVSVCRMGLRSDRFCWDANNIYT